MTDIHLTQQEADILIAMEKHRQDDQPHDYPVLGGSVSIPLVSVDKRESFLLDITRGYIDLMKVTYQSRARRVIPLVRVDVSGPPHTNPDGSDIACPHLHVYRDGYGLKWASSLPMNLFSDPSDLWQILVDFFTYCAITKPPMINKGIF